MTHEGAGDGGPRVTSLAIKCHDIERMRAFYGEAFGIELSPVDVAPDLQCWVGNAANCLFKLVPGRPAADFEGFPHHQPGLQVACVEAVIEVAVRHGGRQEGPVVERGAVRHGCVRDPDGNTVEVFQEGGPGSEPRSEPR